MQLGGMNFHFICL